LPSHFIPPIPGWEHRSIFIGREGAASFYHYDPYGQALSKIERDHARDRGDVMAMLERGLISRDKLLHYFDMIKSELYKYPAIDAEAFLAGVRRVIETETGSEI
jgi:hypothetical protein